jgi:hypothetical protein
MTMKTEMSVLDNGNLCLRVPLKINYKNGRKLIISPDGTKENSNTPLSSNQAMIQMITRGNAWMRLIEEGKIKSIGELSEKTGYHRTHIWRHLQQYHFAERQDENGT